MEGLRKTHDSFIGRIPESGFLRQSQLIPLIVPVSHSTFWRMIRSGKFPSPVKLGPKTTAWRVEDVREWISSQGAPAADRGRG